MATRRTFLHNTAALSAGVVLAQAQNAHAVEEPGFVDKLTGAVEDQKAFARIARAVVRDLEMGDDLSDAPDQDVQDDESQDDGDDAAHRVVATVRLACAFRNRAPLTRRDDRPL